MNSYYIIIILFVLILLVILLKPSFERQKVIKQEAKPVIKPIIKEPKYENHTRIKFSNDIPVEKSQVASKELLSMYQQPKNDIPSDNPFRCKPQKHSIPFSNENIALLK